MMIWLKIIDFDDDQVMTHLRARNGLKPSFIDSDSCDLCTAKGLAFQLYASHHSTCSEMQFFRTIKSHKISDILCKSLNEAGIHSQREYNISNITKVTKFKSEEQVVRADICSSLMIKNRLHLHFIEIKVSDPLAASYVNTHYDRLSQANELKKQVDAKYSKAKVKFLEDNPQFKQWEVHWWPLIFENAGALQDHVLKFFQFISKYISPSRSTTYSGKTWQQNTLDEIYARLIIENNKNNKYTNVNRIKTKLNFILNFPITQQLLKLQVLNLYPISIQCT